ncbi:MAG: S-methyl-5'-thioadenosine phosphorylase [Candidatus Omnitrophica bacterium]|nr:S-methyl-5'-thioadenosine phosphorylase [Candidatus Omnitrophota bacterium]
MSKVGIIGGSGLYEMEGFENKEEVVIIDTPFGQPSGNLITGTFQGIDVVFIARHGKGHRLSPSQINYRANIFEMKRMGVSAILSVSAVGSLKEHLKPMDFVVPDQFLDRTTLRQASFFVDGIVGHVSFADPVDKQLAKILVEAAKQAGSTVHEGGTYVNMEGPQFSTKAESNLYRSWGMDIIGMTNMTEAKLAREAEIAYATLAAVTDYDCWHPDHDSVTVEMILNNLNKNVAKAKEILRIAIPKVGKIEKFEANDALKYALVTSGSVIPEDIKKRYQVLIGKYIK